MSTPYCLVPIRSANCSWVSLTSSIGGGTRGNVFMSGCTGMDRSTIRRPGRAPVGAAVGAVGSVLMGWSSCGRRRWRWRRRGPPRGRPRAAAGRRRARRPRPGWRPAGARALLRRRVGGAWPPRPPGRRRRPARPAAGRPPSPGSAGRPGRAAPAHRAHGPTCRRIGRRRRPAPGSAASCAVEPAGVVVDGLVERALAVLEPVRDRLLLDQARGGLGILVGLVAGLVDVLLVEVEQPRIVERALPLVEEVARRRARRRRYLPDDLEQPAL